MKGGYLGKLHREGHPGNGKQKAQQDGKPLSRCEAAFGGREGEGVAKEKKER